MTLIELATTVGVPARQIRFLIAEGIFPAASKTGRGACPPRRGASIEGSAVPDRRRVRKHPSSTSNGRSLRVRPVRFPFSRLLISSHAL